ncbi:MAG TPA: HAD family hydrolase [Vicinamibacterales bacterium]|nr:HAD family hydrolase [Vicinamibacterales bacterium]
MGIDTAVRRAVFVDRDGVINRPIVRGGRPFAPANVEELEILPGVEEALTRLRAAGFLLVVVTNQPEVSRGTLSHAALDAMHAALRSALPLDDIRVCPHDDRDACDCRKPKPGMVLAAARELGISLARSYVVGDRWRDIAAGRTAGCVTIFVDCGYDEPRPDGAAVTVRSLAEAAEWILSQ